MLVLGFKSGSAEFGATVIFEAPGAYAGTITGAARADVALRYAERGCVGFGREMAADGDAVVSDDDGECIPGLVGE